MSCCACCCFYPKYKRKVDNIYPRNPDGNLVKNEIDKLQYYSCQHPEKLSKIGDYLYQNLKWGLNGSSKNKNYVRNTIDAVDRILIVISPETINYYSNSYLKMIQKLLEQTDLDYQKMATNSFKKFCEKESNQVTSRNYTRNYDQFVCQFSAMCYNNNKDKNIRSEIRISGLQGIGALVKRLQPGESLQASYIWDNMDKIIAALLFIMQESINERPSGANLSQYLIKQQQQQQQQQTSVLSGSVSHLTQPEGDYFSKVGAITDDITVTINNESSALAANSTIKTQLNNNNDDGENIEMRLLASTENLANNAGGGGVASTSLAISSSSPPPLYDNDFSRQQQQTLDPSIEARELLKEISTKADYTTITRVIRPLLTYMDNNNGWQQLEFSDCVFRTVMVNVKQQHAIIIKELIKHLDSHRNSDANMKAHIVKAIGISMQISALQSLSTNAQIYDIFGSLLKHLNVSVEKSFSPLISVNNLTEVNKEEEIKFQNEILNVMKNFTAYLPEYSKTDVITFLTKQIISYQFSYTDLQQQDKRILQSKEQLNQQIRNKYLDSLHEICSKYKPMQVFAAFNSITFLEDFLRLTIMFDPQSRRKTNEILQYLIDKYNILNKIKLYQKRLQQTETPQNTAKSNSNITTSTTTNTTSNSVLDLLDYTLVPSKDDIHFMRKHRRLFLSHLNESIFNKTNVKQNFEAIFTTIVLFLVGVNDAEFLIDLIAFGFHIQYLTLINFKDIKFNLKCDIMCFLTAYFDLLTKLNAHIPSLNQYISKIISIRKSGYYAKYLYPNYVYQVPVTMVVKSTRISNATLSSSTDSINKYGESLTDDEFNSEFDSLAQDYIDFNLKKSNEKLQQKKQQNENVDTSTLSSSSVAENGSRESSPSSNFGTVSENTLKSKIKVKKNWLFDKQTVIDLLHKSGISSQHINQSFSTEFSLSTTYLSPQILSQSYLRYRSINNLNNPTLVDSASISDMNSNIKNQSYSNNTNQKVGSYDNPDIPNGGVGIIGGLGNDSFETSYDSTSQYSETEHPSDKKEFFIGSNSPNDDTPSQHQLTILQTLLKQANDNKDIIPFETVKRYFLNNMTTSQSTNILNNNYSTISSSNANTNNNTNPLYSSLTPNFLQNYNSLDDNEDKFKIINEFKQKTFDEIKYDLNRVNQQNDKYKQVLEFINKEMHTKDSHPQQQTSPLLSILEKFDRTPFQQTHHHHHNHHPQQQQQQHSPQDKQQSQKQLVPLNDIEFPHLFMY